MEKVFQQQHPQDPLEACLVREVELDEGNLEVVAYTNTINATFMLPHRQSQRYEPLPLDLHPIYALREEDAPKVKMKQLPPQFEVCLFRS